MQSDLETERQKSQGSVDTNALSQNILAQKIFNLKSILPYPYTLTTAKQLFSLPSTITPSSEFQILASRSLITQNTSTVTPQFTEFLTPPFYTGAQRDSKTK